MACRFYTNLFASDPEAGGDFFKGKFPFLGDGCKLSLEGSVPKEKVRRALEEMSSYKAPGPDGFMLCSSRGHGTLQAMLYTPLSRGYWKWVSPQLQRLKLYWFSFQRKQDQA